MRSGDLTAGPVLLALDAGLPKLCRRSQRERSKRSPASRTSAKQPVLLSPLILHAPHRRFSQQAPFQAVLGRMSVQWLIRCAIAHLSLGGVTDHPEPEPEPEAVALAGQTTTTFTVTSTGTAIITMKIEPREQEVSWDGPVAGTEEDSESVVQAEDGRVIARTGPVGSAGSDNFSDHSSRGDQILRGYVQLSCTDWCTHNSYTDTLTFLTTTPGQPKIDRHRQLAVCVCSLTSSAIM